MSNAETVRQQWQQLSANLPNDKQFISGYMVELEAFWDQNDLQRGAWVDVWVSTMDGKFTNSIACLEGEGCFDDGPAITSGAIDDIISFAQRYGY
jgi:hypothetical protein